MTKCVHLVFVSFAAVAAAQAPIHELDPFEPGSFAAPIGTAAAGDFDHDGHDDFWLAANDALFVISTYDLSIVRTVAAPSNSIGFGSGFARVGDVDGDGKSDVARSVRVLSGPNQGLSGVAIYSGANATLLQLHWSAAASDLIGSTLNPAGDIDGDGAADVWTSWSSASSSGYRALSGATGATLHDFPFNGPSYTPVGDFDGDGAADLATRVALSSSQFAVRVVSGITLAPIVDIAGAVGDLQFALIVRALPDIDGDGRAELFAYSRSPIRFEVLSGATGARLLALDASASTNGVPSEVLLVGDLDGDGARDLVVNAPANGSATGPTYITVHSGSDGSLLGRDVASGTIELSAVGDANGDGIEDLAYAGWIPNGPNTLKLVSPAHAAPATFCTAKVNSLGCLPQLTHRGGVSATVGDALRLDVTDVRSRSIGALAWSTSRDRTPFAGGTLCIGANAAIEVTPPHSSGPSAPSCSGAYSFTFTRAYLAQHGLVPGTTLYAQFISRDPGFAFPDNVGLSAAVRAEIIP